MIVNILISECFLSVDESMDGQTTGFVEGDNKSRCTGESQGREKYITLHNLSRLAQGHK